MEIKEVKEKAKAVLNALECPEGELSLVLVDDNTISKYNQTYLNRPGPTNVIAFPMKEGEFAHISQEILGDVMISLDTCRREAESTGISMMQRFDELLIHGILHLFGYDHVNSEAEALKMEEKSRQLLEIIQSKKAPSPTEKKIMN